MSALRPPHQSTGCSHNWVRNGHYLAKRRGCVQRWICKACGEERKDFEREVSEQLLQALGLLASGLTLDQAEYLTGLKAETIRRHLTSSCEDDRCWAPVEAGLARLGLGTNDAEYLRLKGRAANLSKRYSVPWRRNKWKALKGLEARIKTIVGKPVLITWARQGYRLCTWQDFERLACMVQRMSPEKVSSLAQFSAHEERVLRELGAPQGTLRLLAAIFSSERKYDLVAQKPLPPPITLSTLAKGAAMEYDQFLSAAIELALKLRKVRG